RPDKRAKMCVSFTEATGWEKMHMVKFRVGGGEEEPYRSFADQPGIVKFCCRLRLLRRRSPRGFRIRWFRRALSPAKLAARPTAARATSPETKRAHDAQSLSSTANTGPRSGAQHGVRDVYYYDV